MIGMSKSLAAEVAARGITVNCVAPGFIATAMTDKLTDEQRARIAGGDSGRPLRHARGDRGRASSIWRAPRRAYVTGQTLHVNGGMAMV